MEKSSSIFLFSSLKKESHIHLGCLGVRKYSGSFHFGWTITWPFASKTESQKAFYRSIFTTSLTKRHLIQVFGVAFDRPVKALHKLQSCSLKTAVMTSNWLSDLKTHSPCQRPENYYLQNRDMSVAHFLPIFLDPTVDGEPVLILHNKTCALSNLLRFLPGKASLQPSLK